MAGEARDGAGSRSVTELVTVNDLALENRPRQFSLVERAASVFSQSPSVTHLSVRGSLATGTADRMSDIDFVVGIDDAKFCSFLQILDALMVTELGAILPGWRDTIVGKLGGLGYVYLVASDGKLYQIDLYVAPDSCVADIQRRTNARLLLTAPPQGGIASPEEDPSGFIEGRLAMSQSTSELLVEILVLAQMMRKRIIRGQHFVIYSETHLLMTAVKNLIREALAPTSRHWGWYHLHDEIGALPSGPACLEDLSVLIASPPIRTQDALRSVVERIIRIVKRVAPETIEHLDPSVETYRRYLDL